MVSLQIKKIKKWVIYVPRWLLEQKFASHIYYNEIAPGPENVRVTGTAKSTEQWNNHEDLMIESPKLRVLGDSTSLANFLDQGADLLMHVTSVPLDNFICLKICLLLFFFLSVILKLFCIYMGIVCASKYLSMGNSQRGCIATAKSRGSGCFCRVTYRTRHWRLLPRLAGDRLDKVSSTKAETPFI